MASSQRPSIVVAVHVGAGFHSRKLAAQYEEIIKHACQTGIEVFDENHRQSHSHITALAAAIRVLEESELTNTGRGSNLTYDGHVECDACLMDDTRMYGSIAAAPGVRFPIEIAKKLLLDQLSAPQLPLGRVRPMMLAGESVRTWAQHNNLSEAVADEEYLVTHAARVRWQDHRHRLVEYEEQVSCGECSQPQPERDGIQPPPPKKRKLVDDEEYESELYDTVGAICVTSEGRVAAGVSSGGISLKCSGRVGEAAVCGSGCWAERRAIGSVAISVSGTGEHIMRAMLAKECADFLFVELERENDEGEETSSLRTFFEHRFLGRSESAGQKYAGLVAVLLGPSSEHDPSVAEVRWAHTTPSMAIGWASTYQRAPAVLISRSCQEAGTAVSVGGAELKL